MARFRVDEGGRDGVLNLHEACGQVSGMKLQIPAGRPFRDRTAPQAKTVPMILPCVNCTPLQLKTELQVPHIMQIVIQFAQPPSDGDTNGAYFHILKHAYLYRNNFLAPDCVDMCGGNPLRLDRRHPTKLALASPNFMLDKMGGKQLRLWLTKPEFEKKVTADQPGSR